MTHKTVQIMPSDPASQGPFVVINQADFDPLVHRLYADAQDEHAASADPPAKRGPGKPHKPKPMEP